MLQLADCNHTLTQTTHAKGHTLLTTADVKLFNRPESVEDMKRLAWAIRAKESRADVLRLIDMVMAVIPNRDGRPSNELGEACPVCGNAVLVREADVNKAPPESNTPLLESNIPGVESNSESNKPFDRAAYQRDYMAKRRAKPNDSVD
jgi:hypothetical protein